MKIRTKNSFTSGNAALETILPFAYDENTDLYYPIGYCDEDGVIHIEQLPEETDIVLEKVGSTGEKSIGGSIKLFFQKVAWSKLSGVKEYDKLALHRRGADGLLEEIAYYGSERTLNNASEIAQSLQGGDALLLMHGIIGDTTEMVKAVFESDALRQPYSGILTFDYENLNSGIEATAKKLKSMLQDCGFGDSRRLTILCHSMGGLVSRYMIEHLEGDRFVKKLIQCGTPNGGSEISDFRRKVTGWLVSGINGVALFKPYLGAAAFLASRLERSIFNNLNEMDPDSEFLAKLNDPGKKRPDIPYYLVGGDTTQILGKWGEDTSLAKKIIQTLKYKGIDMAVFDSEPNDMAVKVERMQTLPWGKHDTVKILACDHISYFADPESLAEIHQLIP